MLSNDIYNYNSSNNDKPNAVYTKTSNSVQDAVKYIADKDKNSIILIIGSIFLIGEVLNLN